MAEVRDMKQAVVTGANGFIGKMLVSALLEQGYRVVALARRFDAALQEREDVVCVDVSGKTNRQLREKIPQENYDCFFHLAWAGTSGPARADYKAQLDNVRLACR